MITLKLKLNNKMEGRRTCNLKIKELKKLLHTLQVNEFFKTLSVEDAVDIIIKKLIKIEYASCGSQKLVDLLEGRRLEDKKDLHQEAMTLILESNLKLYNEKHRKLLIKKIRKYLKNLLNYTYQCINGKVQRIDAIELDALDDRIKEEVYQSTVKNKEAHKKLNKNQIDFIKSLTGKQKLIVYEVANGCTYSQVAEHLGVSVGTIKTTMYRLKKYATNII